MLIDTIDNYKEKPEKQIELYVGKIAIQSFLDIINAFELSTNRLVSESKFLSKKVNERIQKKVDLIESSWNTNDNGRSRSEKKNLQKMYFRKIYEMKFIRDTLKKEDIIDEIDYKILEFSWDIRNSMHNNFLAIKDIEFSAPGTSLHYSFNFKKGEELYHPEDLKSFYMITEQIIAIQFKILQKLNFKDK